MKRSHLRIFAGIGKVVAIAAVIAYPAAGFAQIAGSVHDFSTSPFSGGQICLPCHAPHNTPLPGEPSAPLWNHEVTTATFIVYSSDTMDSVPGQPEGNSKLCLSCHDGTVAVDSFGGGTGTFIISGPANVGTDLSNDHPISITYDAALVTADGELQAVTADSSLGGSIEEDLLFGGMVQCATCHDVHNGGGVGSPGGDPLLRITKAASAICLQCHLK
jgi:hypothetical protein